jgi:hypothetical protein
MSSNASRAPSQPCRPTAADVTVKISLFDCLAQLVSPTQVAPLCLMIKNRVGSSGVLAGPSPLRAREDGSQPRDRG